LLCAIAACRPNDNPTSSEDSTSTETVAPRLESATTVVAPSLDTAADWLARPDLLQYDGQTGHLFALDLITKTIVEFTTAGGLVRLYAGQIGGGPGEVRNPLEFTLTPDHVFLWDEGRATVLRYSRSGDYHEFPVDPQYKDISSLPTGDLILIPSAAAGFTADVLDADGNVIRQVGAMSLERADCVVACEVHGLPSGGFLVLLGIIPSLTVMSPDGDVLRTFDFEQVEDLEVWRAEEQELMGQHVREAQGRQAVGGKLWVWDMSIVGPSTALLNVLPANPHERGRELWLVDLETGDVVRTGYDRTTVGNSAALGDAVYAIDVADAAVYSYPANQELRPYLVGHETHSMEVNP
jgi:hypothetical protein